MELRGRREICEHVKRTWTTVVMLWETNGFPMSKLGGVWVSDTEAIKEWRNKALQRR